MMNRSPGEASAPGWPSSSSGPSGTMTSTRIEHRYPQARAFLEEHDLERVPVTEDGRLVGVVLVTQVDRPALRALAYARSLGLDEVRALSVALDRAETDALRARWERHAGAVPLDIVDAPLRDIGAPVLSYARGITSAPGTVAVVFMPELIVTGAPRLFHNQRELYLRRLLLFEPRVILASVPYRLA